MKQNVNDEQSVMTKQQFLDELELSRQQSADGQTTDAYEVINKMKNKYVKLNEFTASGSPDFSANKRIGVLKGKQIFAPSYDFDQDNEEIARMFGEMD